MQPVEESDIAIGECSRAGCEIGTNEATRQPVHAGLGLAVAGAARRGRTTALDDGTTALRRYGAMPSTSAWSRLSSAFNSGGSKWRFTVMA